MKKKKPAKRTQSNKKGNREVNKNALRELWLQSKGKDFLIEKLNKAERWARAGDKYSEALERLEDAKNRLTRLKAKQRGKRSGEERRETFKKYITWREIENMGREIHNKFKSYKRLRIAKEILKELKKDYREDQIPNIRTICNHLPKLS